MKKLNEDPDGVRWIGDPIKKSRRPGPIYGNDDGITFTLFNNFNLYSNDSQVTHWHLYQELSSFLLYNRFDSPNKTQYSGKLSEMDKEKIKDVLAVGGNDRIYFMRQMPNVIQGRIWTESKVISFWNELAQIAARKNDIINFIRMDMKRLPQNFQYEIKDELYSHDEFLSGEYIDNNEFDPAKLHTLAAINRLPPDQKAKILKSMGYANEMIQGESFKSWLGKLEK